MPYRNQIFKHLIISFLISASILCIYFVIDPTPGHRFDHFIYLAKSILTGKLDTPDLPQFYHDVVRIEDKNYIPFPPGPAIVLIPFISIFPKITQQQVSIIIGALNAGLIYLLLTRFTTKLSAVIVSFFFALGTNALWNSVIGTTWLFAHTVAFFFLTLSLITLFSEKYFLAGVFLFLASISRYPVAFSFPFFFLHLWGNKKALVYFMLGFSPFLPFTFLYNWLRFGSIFETGYIEIYKRYVSSGYPYSIVKTWWPSIPNFGYFDIRNIPLHLYTFLIMPPKLDLTTFALSPSGYGMGIVFSSPLLFFGLLPKLKDRFERNLFFGMMPVALIEFMHYAQGWVQFGYRFAMDFLIFILIIISKRFKVKPIFIAFFIISLAVNIWGTLTDIKFGLK